MILNHGGQILLAEKSFGISRKEIIDFSSNINPVGFPKVVTEIITDAIDSLMMYPDNDCTELREEIAKYLNLLPENIVPANGAMEVITMFFQNPDIRRVLILAPTFGEYERLAGLSGIKCDFVELFEEDEFEIDEKRVISKLKDVDALIICNPNNPTSKLIKRKYLTRIIQKCQDKGVRVLVDETFIELTLEGNNNSVVDMVEENRNLVVMRAFTKYFAMPGIRLGYAVLNSIEARRLRNIKLTWSVNGFAAGMGKILREENSFREKTLQWMNTEILYLTEELSKFKSIKVFKPESIFVLIKIMKQELSASKIYEMIGRKGILIRNASNFKFLDEQFIRVAVKDRKSNDMLLEKMREIFE